MVSNSSTLSASF